MNIEQLQKELRLEIRELSTKVERHERYFWVALALLGACGITGAFLISSLSDARAQIAALKLETGDIAAAKASAITALKTTTADEVKSIKDFVSTQSFLAQAREGMVKMNEDYFIRFSDGPWDLSLMKHDMKYGQPVGIAGRDQPQRWRIER